MTKSLVIVESATKCKTISKYLNSDESDNKYIITASCGHITELSNKYGMGFDKETWEADFIPSPSKQKIIYKIRELAKEADNIYLASDLDAEGEAISYHIKECIKDLIKHKPCYRIRFNEITSSALKKAINNPTNIDMDIVNAQMTRSILDKLVGFSLSPMLWNKFNSNYLSAGRCQSIAVLLCINRYNDILNTKLSLYWNIIGKFSKYEAYLYNENDLVKIINSEDIKKVLKKLSFENKWKVNLEESNSLQNPPAPFTTTSLQSEVYQRFKIGSKKTMKIAQTLYENGYITYMRTDSVSISDEAKKKIISYIKDNYGDEYVKRRAHKNKIVNAQEAHECIRITNPKKLDIDFEDITPDHKKIYNLIWKRTIACQMIAAEYIDVTLNIIDDTILPYKFIYNKSLLIKKGYLEVYSPDIKIDDVDEIRKLNGNEIKPSYFIAKGNINEPPSLYNEVGLIKLLEKEGIGRPSTYASIIEKIFSKGYVEKGSNPQQKLKVESIKKNSNNKLEIINEDINIGGNNKDLLVPTDLGINITEYLKNLIPFLLDIKFTAHMEEALDKISNKNATKLDTLNAFYNRLKPVLDNEMQKNNQSTTDKTNFKKETGILKTKFGYAYYNADTNKYTNIESYLKWKKITVKELTERDIKFLSSLPKKIGDYTINIGQYGLYLKDRKDNNIKLDKNKWEDAVNGKLNIS
jgi:DNA topoisomerase-1